jgi:hypothetical protein
VPGAQPGEVGPLNGTEPDEATFDHGLPCREPIDEASASPSFDRFAILALAVAECQSRLTSGGRPIYFPSGLPKGTRRSAGHGAPFAPESMTCGTLAARRAAPKPESRR